MLKHNTTWFKKVYIACGRTDLRLGVDGLATLIQSQFGMNALQEQVLFLFCGTKKDRIKGLLWEGDGFVLLREALRSYLPSRHEPQSVLAVRTQVGV